MIVSVVVLIPNVVGELVDDLEFVVGKDSVVITSGAVDF